MTLCYLPTPFLFHSSFLSFLSSSLRILKLSIADSASQEGETPPAACASVRMGHRPAPDHLYLGKCTQCGCRYLSSKCFTVCALYTSVCVSVPCPCRLPFPVVCTLSSTALGNMLGVREQSSYLFITPLLVGVFGAEEASVLHVWQRNIPTAQSWVKGHRLSLQ